MVCEIDSTVQAQPRHNLTALCGRILQWRVAILAVAYLTTLAPGRGFTDDSGRHVMQAANLVEGHTYTAISYGMQSGFWGRSGNWLSPHVSLASGAGLQNMGRQFQGVEGGHRLLLWMIRNSQSQRRQLVN